MGFASLYPSYNFCCLVERKRWLSLNAFVPSVN
ncbi:hypothetical protein SAMN05443247_02430 [Bradyrhizobium erythrophlei]|nr:hypothetical protein SAMN05443247_02430 [Bradyrhizobium erythrophlei]